jgi:hypothetical protein
VIPYFGKNSHRVNLPSIALLRPACFLAIN